MVSRIALGAAFLFGSAVLLPPASAQTADLASYSLTKDERAALNALITAMRAGNYSAAQAALPAARSTASSDRIRYLVYGEQLRLGLATNNRQMQAEAVDAMLATGQADPAQTVHLVRSQAGFAMGAGNWKKAEASLNRLLELQPNDLGALEVLARLRTEQRNYPAAVGLVDRLIEQRQAANQPVTESMYKYALNYATVTKATPQAIKFARGLVTAYPTRENWRDVLLTYRDMARPDATAELDLYRLLRATRSLAGERDYLAFAEMLSKAGQTGEAKAVLEEGIAANHVDPAKAPAGALRKTLTTKAAAEKKGLAAQEKAALAAATGANALKAADAYFGQGDYAKAAELYRAALQKGSVDPAQVSTRLGMALGLAGQKAEAQAALQAVTGPRADLAGFALLWLSQRA